ncbi:hypothetical protein CS542_08645 [Pedobacter sp. IW39]|nr:hypothetical protein CS542_08645 [Pedobacter sp. IW39]
MQVFYFNRRRNMSRKNGITFYLDELMKSCDIISTHLPKIQLSTEKSLN